MVWTGATKGGYGELKVGCCSCLLVHRLVWIEAHGPVPRGRFVLHHCDTRACAGLDHLYLGTPADNGADAKAKRNGTRAERVAAVRARAS
jgi:hypothetical protein